MATEEKFGALSAHGVLANSPDIFPITPTDDVDLADMARAIRCRPDGQAGTLRIKTAAGVVRNTYISVGEVLQVMAVQVHSAGTTATNLEGLP